MRAALAVALLALAALIQPGKGQAQDTAIFVPGGTRPFAEPLYWLNATPDDRLPIEERRLRSLPGVVTPGVPAAIRSGLTWWIGGGAEFRSGDAADSSALLLSPGLFFRHETRRLAFEGSYAAESVLDDDDGYSFSAQAGVASLSYRIGARSRIDLLDVFSDTREASDAAPAGVIAQGTRVRSNLAEIEYAQDPSQRTGLAFGYRNRRVWLDGVDTADIREDRVTGRYGFAISPTARLEGRAAFGVFDIGAFDARRGAVSFRMVRDLGAQLSARGAIGLVHLSGDETQTAALFDAGLVRTGRDWRVELSLDRDIDAVPGLGSPSINDEIGIDALMRLRPGLIVDLSVGAEWIETIEANPTRIDSRSASGRLSRALSRDLWLWGEVEATRSKSNGATERDYRLSLGISRRLGG